MYRTIVYLVVNIIDVVFSCGGIWSENMEVSVLPELHNTTVCDYTGQTSITPTDVRSDTQYLILTGNSLVDGDLDVPLLYSQAASLLAINLNSNLLTQFPDLTLFTATLRSISVKFNRITYLDLGQLHNFPHVWFLDVSNNKLSTAGIIPNPENTLVPTLRQIRLSGNKITEVNWALFAHIPQLNKISLSRNSISELKNPIPSSITIIHLNKCFSLHGPFNLTMFSHSTSLHLTKNEMTGFHPIVSMSALRVLNVAENQWRILNLESLHGIAPNLTVLIIDDNSITEVLLPKNNGHILPFLERLSLVKNPITTVPHYCHARFNNIPDGFRLDLGGTNLYCGEPLLWLNMCPYHITLASSPAYCNSPQELQGQMITELGGKLLDFAIKVDLISRFVLSSSTVLSPSAGPVMWKQTTHQGFVQCARLCSAVQGISFTFIKDSETCVIYHDDSGAYIVEEM